VNPNAFFYRHVLPGETRRNGPWTEEETALFIKTLREHPPELGHWGLFARHIPGRVGYQCNAYHKKLLAAGLLPGAPPREAPVEDDGQEAAAARAPKPAAADPQPPVCEFADREFADRYPLKEVASPRFVPEPRAPGIGFGARLREFTRDPENRARLAAGCDPYMFGLT
jgi:hypothetical protein